MVVTDELVEQLAHLARLKIKPEEKESLKEELRKMITFVEKLNELDTTGVEPLLFMTEEMNAFREDKVEGSVSREDALKSAHSKDDQFFKVPKVINK